MGSSRVRQHYRSTTGEGLASRPGLRLNVCFDWLTIPEPSPTSGAKDQIKRGKWLIREGKFEEAAKLFVDVCKATPDSAEAFVLLGASYFRLGRLDVAYKAVGRALMLDPGNSTAAKLRQQIKTRSRS